MPHVLLLNGRPMHPLLRALLLVAGAAIVTLIVIFGFFALLALAGVGAVAALVARWRSRHHPQPMPAAASAQAQRDPRVLEGEYVVVQHDHDPV